MGKLSMLTILFTFLFSCERISDNSDSYLTARIAGFDLNCSNCILEFPDNSLDVKEKLGESPDNYYQAVNLNKGNYEIGQWLNVRIRKPNSDEISQCNISEPAGSYRDVFITDLENYGNLRFNETVTLSWHECLSDPQNKMYICFDSVLNDSRCPNGVQCFWEGNAKARFKFGNYPDQPVYFNLNTHLGFTNDTIIGGYKFTLEGIKPYPDINHRIRQKDYKAELSIEIQ